MDMAPDVISLSAGTHTWLDRGLLSFRFFINGPLRERRHSVLVAAAGNDGLDWKFSPAKMKGVLSVGALSASEESRAWFSNHGDWVKVYAPGENLVQAYAHGTYKYLEPPYPPPARFDGMALWSGTSFSTPVVSGLIAARMSGTGETAHEAARALLRLAARQALPGVGAVLRPGQACLPECGDPAECGCSHHGGRCHDRRG
jgi:subtilisin family serine protease